MPSDDHYKWTITAYPAPGVRITEVKMIKYFLDKPALQTFDLTFERKTDGASGFDLMANIGLIRTIEVGRRWFCPTGLYLEMPRGVEAQIRTRSGLSRNHGVIVLNAPGTVDSDYRGEVCVTLINLGEQPYEVVPGERIAQIVFCPVFPDCKGHLEGAGAISAFTPVRVDSRDELKDTVRGAGGHGSTGR